MDMVEAIFKSAWERLTASEEFRAAVGEETVALAGRRIYPYRAPPDAPMPYLVNRVGGGGSPAGLVVGVTRMDIHIFDSAATPRGVWALRDVVLRSFENWIDVSQPAASHIRYHYVDDDELPEDDEQFLHLVIAFEVRYARTKLIEAITQ